MTNVNSFTRSGTYLTQGEGFWVVWNKLVPGIRSCSRCQVITPTHASVYLSRLPLFIPQTVEFRCIPCLRSSFHTAQFPPHPYSLFQPQTSPKLRKSGIWNSNLTRMKEKVALQELQNQNLSVLTNLSWLVSFSLLITDIRYWFFKKKNKDSETQKRWELFKTLLLFKTFVQLIAVLKIFGNPEKHRCIADMLSSLRIS